MLAFVTISDVSMESGTVIGCSISVATSWGHNLTDHFSRDLNGVTPAQVLAGLKNKVIAWAATPDGGGVTVTSGQVWVFGAPQ